MGTPGVEGDLGGIVVWIVVIGDGNIQPLCLVTAIFGIKGERIVLRVSRHKYLSPVLGRYYVGSRNIRQSDELQLGASKYLRNGCLGVPGMGGEESVIKSSDKGHLGTLNAVMEDAEHLLGKRTLGNAVVVVKTCLCAPAEVEAGVNVLL